MEVYSREIQVPWSVGTDHEASGPEAKQGQIAQACALHCYTHGATKKNLANICGMDFASSSAYKANVSKIRRCTNACRIDSFYLLKEMNMIYKNLKLLSVAVFAATMAGSSFAQVSNFEGMSVYAASGYSAWKVESSNLSSDSTQTYDTTNTAGLPLFLGVDYTWALGSESTLGLSLEGNFVKSSVGTGTYASDTTSGTIDAQVNNSYQISILPGLLVNKDTLLYGKLGYYSASLTASADSVSSNYTQTGYSYGIGIKRAFDNKMYVFGEINARAGVSASQTTPDGSTGTFDQKMGGTSALVGVGIHF